MLTIYITPCLLGFDVKTQNGSNGFIRSQGIFTMSELIIHLIFTESEYRIVLS